MNILVTHSLQCKNIRCLSTFSKYALKKFLCTFIAHYLPIYHILIELAGKKLTFELSNCTITSLGGITKYGK